MSNALLGTDERPETVLRMIAEREKRLAELNARLVNARTSSLTSNMDFATFEAAARERLQDLNGLFSRHVEAAHRVIEALLDGPLTFTAKENRYHIAGQVGAGWMTFVEGVS